MEALEERTLLSSLVGPAKPVQVATLGSPDDVFAVLSGHVSDAGHAATIPIRIDSASFDFPASGRVLLDFHATAATSGKVAPLVIHVVPQDVVAASRNAKPSRITGLAGTTRARLGDGVFLVQAITSAGVTGEFHLGVVLVGDVNGDHRVDRGDLGLIRSHRGQRRGSSGFLAESRPES